MAVRAVCPSADAADHRQPPAKVIQLPVRRCPTHGGQLLDRDHDGREFASPICLECLPPHQPDCPQGDAMNKTEVLWAHGVIGRYTDGERECLPSVFRRYFGKRHVPACLCANRQLAFSADGRQPNARQPEMKTSDAPTMSPWVFTELGRRFRVMMFRETQDLSFLEMELGDPIKHTPGIEAHAGPDAETAWKRLVRFETEVRRSARRHR